LVVCYSARIPGVVFGAAGNDVARYGFEDLQFYRELTFPAGRRLLQEDATEDHLRQNAAAVLRSWAEWLPFDAEPKF
jgi:guanine deaminase